MPGDPDAAAVAATTGLVAVARHRRLFVLVPTSFDAKPCGDYCSARMFQVATTRNDDDNPEIVFVDSYIVDCLPRKVCS